MAELQELLKQKKQEDYKTWLAQDFTKSLLNYLKTDLQNIQEEWAGGAYTTESFDGTIQLNSMALGGVRSLNKIIHAIEDGFLLEE